MSDEFVSCERVEVGGALRGSIRRGLPPTAARSGALHLLSEIRLPGVSTSSTRSVPGEVVWCRVLGVTGHLGSTASTAATCERAPAGATGDSPMTQVAAQLGHPRKSLTLDTYSQGIVGN